MHFARGSLCLHHGKRPEEDDHEVSREPRGVLLNVWHQNQRVQYIADCHRVCNQCTILKDNYTDLDAPCVPLANDVKCEILE